MVYKKITQVHSLFFFSFFGYSALVLEMDCCIKPCFLQFFSIVAHVSIFLVVGSGMVVKHWYQTFFKVFTCVCLKMKICVFTFYLN